MRAAFIPFGEIVNIEIPPDYENHEKHRGFSFIEYELAEDAAAAIDNMVYSEFAKVNLCYIWYLIASITSFRMILSCSAKQLL